MEVHRKTKNCFHKHHKNKERYSKAMKTPRWQCETFANPLPISKRYISGAWIAKVQRKKRH